MNTEQPSDPDMPTALESGDFDAAMSLLESMSSEQLSELPLPDKCTPLHYVCQHDLAKQLITNYHYNIESKDV